MASRGFVSASAASLAFILMAAPAIAAPTAAQRETARRLMDEAKERTRSGDRERALEAYQKAHDIMRVPSTGIALAKAHLALGHLVEARDVALEVTRMPRDNGEPPIFEKARKEARELEQNVKPRIPTVRISVKGGPATQILVDEVEVAPLLLGEPVALNPGKHTVVARNADGTDKRADVELTEREGKEVELTLPVPAPAVVTTTLPEKPQVEPPRRRESERTTGANVLVFGGFGLAVVGLAAGGLAGALTLSKASTVKTQCANNVCDPKAKSDLDSASTMATISTLGFGAAGVGVVCGVVGLLLPRTNVETALHSEQEHVGVWFAPGSAGLRGSF